jgi:hypothetical protein
MSRTLVKVVFVVLGLGPLSLAFVGCGGDDTEESAGTADCSACSSDQQGDCNDTFAQCTSGGGTAEQCQLVVDLFCGDIGFDAGFGGSGNGGSGGAADGGS